MSRIDVEVTLENSCPHLLIAILNSRNIPILLENLEIIDAENSKVEYARTLFLESINNLRLIVVNYDNSKLLAEDKIIRYNSDWYGGAEIKGCLGMDSEIGRNLHKYYLDNGEVIPENVNQTESSSLWFWMTFIILLILLGFFFYLWRKKKKSTPQESLQQGGLAFR